MLNLAMACDKRYFNCLYTSFGSFASHVQSCDINLFLILKPDISELQISEFKEFVNNKFPYVNLTIYKTDNDNFGFKIPNNPGTEYLSTDIVYYRCILPILMKDCDKVLHMDLDTVTLTSPIPLYDFDMGDNLIAGVYDRINLNEKMHKHITDLGVKVGNYVNAGVLLMNLKEMRHLDLASKMLRASQESTYPFNDQDILNRYCRGRIALLPKRCSIFPDDVPEEYEALGYTADDLGNPMIVHYLGAKKPWTDPNVPRAEYWNNFNI